MLNKLVFIVLLFVVLIACSPVPSEEVYVGDSTQTVYLVSFKILCDKELKLAMAQTWAIKDDGTESSYFIGGPVSREVYEEFCVNAKVVK